MEKSFPTPFLLTLLPITSAPEGSNPLIFPVLSFLFMTINQHPGEIMAPKSYPFFTSLGPTSLGSQSFLPAERVLPGPMRQSSENTVGFLFVCFFFWIPLEVKGHPARGLRGRADCPQVLPTGKCSRADSGHNG